MKTRTLGSTGVKLTTVGLGTWAHGGGGWRYSWGPQDDNDSIRTVRAALDAGINWIDTAAVYGLGHAEEVLGKALKGLAHRPFVATKCSRVWDDAGNIRSDLSPEGIARECEASLRRLQTDAIDLFQIHWPNPDKQIEDAWSAIARLVKEGKVRYAGVSNSTSAQIQRLLPIHPVASSQPPYSMLRREIEAEHLDFCRRNNIGVITYSPLQKGLLTGKVTRQWVTSLPPDDHRRMDAMFKDPEISRILRKVEALTAVATKKKIPLGRLAIGWILRRPEVTAAIVGARRPEQITDTARAMDVTLSAANLDKIEEILLTS